MEKLENIFLKIKEEENFKVTNFAEMDVNNKHFTDFEYFTIEKNGLFFSINKEYFGGFKVTAYSKIDWNTKQQVTYLKEFYEFDELKTIINNIIEENKKRKLQPLKDTYKQTIHYELKTFVNFNGKYQTLKKHLQDIAGTREKEILHNIDHVEMKQNDGKYYVLEFYNKNGQSFAINTKNIERLIIS